MKELTSSLIENYLDGVVPPMPSMEEANRVLATRGFSSLRVVDNTGVSTRPHWVCRDKGESWVLTRAPAPQDWYEMHYFPGKNPRSSGFVYGTLQFVMREFDSKMTQRKPMLVIAHTDREI